MPTSTSYQGTDINHAMTKGQHQVPTRAGRLNATLKAEQQYPIFWVIVVFSGTSSSFNGLPDNSSSG